MRRKIFYLIVMVFITSILIINVNIVTKKDVIYGLMLNNIETIAYGESDANQGNFESKTRICPSNGADIITCEEKTNSTCDPTLSGGSCPDSGSNTSNPVTTNETCVKSGHDWGAPNGGNGTKCWRCGLVNNSGSGKGSDNGNSGGNSTGNGTNNGNSGGGGSGGGSGNNNIVCQPHELDFTAGVRRCRKCGMLVPN